MDIMKLFKDYLEENYNLEGERNTIKAYYSDVNQFINFFKDHFGEQIVDFSNAHIIEYRKYLLDEMSLKFSSINRKMAAISIYENFLIDKNIRKSGVKIIKKRDFYKIDRPYITSDMLPKETMLSKLYTSSLLARASTSAEPTYCLFISCLSAAMSYDSAISSSCFSSAGAGISPADLLKLSPINWLFSFHEKIFFISLF